MMDVKHFLLFSLMFHSNGCSNRHFKNCYTTATI